MAPPITIWHFISSPPSWAVRMTASILKLPVELKLVKIYELEGKTPEFRKMNPAGAVPVIKDGDLYVSESHTIIKYLLEKYGNEEHKRLYPSDLVQRAAVDQIIFYNCGFGFNTAKKIVLSFIFEGQTEFTPTNIKEVENIYETVEMFMDKKDYVATNEFTIADLAMGSTMIALDTTFKVDEVKYPFVAAWLNRLKSKAVFQEIVSPGVDYLANLLKETQKKNREKKANL